MLKRLKSNNFAQRNKFNG